MIASSIVQQLHEEGKARVKYESELGALEGARGDWPSASTDLGDDGCGHVAFFKLVKDLAWLKRANLLEKPTQNEFGKTLLA